MTLAGRAWQFMRISGEYDKTTGNLPDIRYNDSRSFFAQEG